MQHLSILISECLPIVHRVTGLTSVPSFTGQLGADVTPGITKQRGKLNTNTASSQRVIAVQDEGRFSLIIRICNWSKRYILPSLG